MSAQLEIEGLSVVFRDGAEERLLLEDITVSLNRGEILGLVGESGSGKSLLCRTVIGLLPSRRLQVTGGSVKLEGAEILNAPMDGIRGQRIGMIFQNPTSHLDPVMTIGRQIAEGLTHHKGLGKAAARAEAIDLLRQVGFPDPPRAFGSFAHEFSGGMRQRAMIAVALACDPEILIADEPTTALDVTIQAQILRLLTELRDRRGLSIILITHDLGVVAQTCDRIAVMRHGRIVEQGEKRALLADPQHEYTKALIASHPSLSHAGEEPETHPHDRQPIFEADALEVAFPQGGFLTRKPPFRALKGVSLRIWPGETVGIVGESGSGKSTLARAMLGLTPIAGGEVIFDGSRLTRDRETTLKRLRSEAAMVFQDPFNALNPRLTIGETLAEVLQTQGETPRGQIPARIGELMDMVGLDRAFTSRRPRSLSGGQCQRAGIARALAVNPRVIIADECVAALDVTIQAQIVALFRELTARHGLTLVFIAHDLAIVRNLCERVVVMHHGEIVEDGPSARVFARPERPYTAALIAAIPDIDPDRPINGGATPIQQELTT
ncbi:ABC transporter ATP-binding protein [Rhodobacter sp.]